MITSAVKSLAGSSFETSPDRGGEKSQMKTGSGSVELHKSAIFGI